MGETVIRFTEISNMSGQDGERSIEIIENVSDLDIHDLMDKFIRRLLRRII